MISLEELKERREQIRNRRQILITHAAEEEKFETNQEVARAVW